MRKFIGIMILSAFVFQVTDALQLKWYKEFQDNEKDLFGKHFDSSTDLIRGLITLRDGVLREHRNFGNTRFHFSDPNACSRDDKSDDAMTQLLILTHPSAGGAGFNATGNGSISEDFKDPEHILQIIAKMFKIANEARKRERNRTSENDDIGTIIKKAKNENIDEETYETAVLSFFNFQTLSGIYNNKLTPKKMVIEAAIRRIEAEKDDDELDKFIKGIPLVKKTYTGAKSNGANTLYDAFKKEMNEKYELSNSVSGEMTSSQAIDLCQKLTNKPKDVLQKMENNLILRILRSSAEEWKCAHHVSESINNPAELDNFIAYSDLILTINKTNFNNDKTKKEQVLEKLSQRLDSLKGENKKIYKLFDLAKSVAGAVLLERLNDKNKRPDDKNKLSDEEKWVNHPYYEGYTNDIICAYACEVISGNGNTVQKDLKKLAKMMPKHTDKPYVSELTDIVSSNDDIFPSFIPFEVGRPIVTNGSEVLKDSVPGGFADCVETMMRQLFSLIFCSGSGELKLDRIPNKKLRDFFEGKDIREMANSGSQKIRNNWATICSRQPKEKIAYSRSEKFELKPGWINAIKLFCLLMEGYSKKDNVANLIADINNDVKKVENKSDVIDVLNTLLEIRDDIALEAVDCGLDKNFGDVIGCITIQPKDVSKRINNAVKFNSMIYDKDGGHAWVDPIAGIPVRRIKNMKQISDLASKLFHDKDDILGFYKSYLNESRTKTDWIDLVDSLARLKKFEGITLKERNCDGVIATLQEIFNKKTGDQFEIIEQSLKQKGEEVSGTIKLRASGKDLIISLGEDNQSTSSPELRYVNDLYFKRGLAFTNKDSSLNESPYPILDFYSRTNKDIQPGKTAFTMLSNRLTKPYFQGLYRFSLCTMDDYKYYDILEYVFKNSKEVNKDYIDLCIENTGMDQFREFMFYMAPEGKLPEEHKEKIIGKLRKALLDDRNIPTFIYHSTSWNDLFSCVEFDKSVLKTLAKYAEEMPKALKENTKERHNSIRFVANIINNIKDLDTIPDTDEAFVKLRESIQKFSKEENYQAFCSINKNTPSENRIKLLLPICSISDNDREIAEQAIKQLNGNVDDRIIPVSWAIDEGKLDEYLEQIKGKEFFKEKCRALLHACNQKDERRGKILKIILDNFPDILDLLNTSGNGEYSSFSSDDVKKILEKQDSNNIGSVCYWLVKHSNKNGVIGAIVNWVVTRKLDFADSLISNLVRSVSKETIKEILDCVKQNDDHLVHVCQTIINACKGCKETNTKAVADWIGMNRLDLANLLISDLAKYFSEETTKNILDDAKQNGKDLAKLCQIIIDNCKGYYEETNIKVVADWIRTNQLNLADSLMSDLAKYFSEETSEKILDNTKQNGKDLM